MINQLWNQSVCDLYNRWESAFYTWAYTQGMTDPIEWIKANGTPSGDPALSVAYHQMQADNRAKELALKRAYNLINPCPINGFGFQK